MGVVKKGGIRGYWVWDRNIKSESQKSENEMEMKKERGEDLQKVCESKERAMSQW